MQFKKQKWMFRLSIVILILIVSSVFYFLTAGSFNITSTMYANIPMIQDVTCMTEQMEYSLKTDKVEFIMSNKTGRDITVSTYTALEYKSGDKWFEVLSRLHKRASEEGRTAVQPFIPANGERREYKELGDYGKLKPGTYRLVKVVTNSDDQTIGGIISNEFKLVDSD